MKRIFLVSVLIMGMGTLLLVSATKNPYKTDEKRVTLSPGELKEKMLWKKGIDSTKNKS